jgi:hypothetical protein
MLVGVVVDMTLQHQLLLLVAMVAVAMEVLHL